MDLNGREIDRRGEFCPNCGGFTSQEGCPDCGADTIDAVLYTNGDITFTGYTDEHSAYF